MKTCTTFYLYLFTLISLPVVGQPVMTLWITPDSYHNDHDHTILRAYPCDTSYYIFYQQKIDTLNIALKNEGDEALIVHNVYSEAIKGAFFQVITGETYTIPVGEMFNLQIRYQLPPDYVSGINGGITIESNDPDKTHCRLAFEVGCSPTLVTTDIDILGVEASCNSPVVHASQGAGVIPFKILSRDSLQIYNYNSDQDTTVLAIWIDQDQVYIPNWLRIDNNFLAGISEQYPGPTIAVEPGKATITGVLEVETINTMSDQRLKKEIQPIENALDKVVMLNPSSYYLKDNDIIKSKQFGFTAQELEKVLPDLVSENDKNLKSINYIQLVPWLTAALQEQHQLIKHLEARILELEN